MQIKTTSGSGAAGLGIVGTGLALALPDVKWIGWLLVVAGLIVFVFDVRIERGQLRAGRSRLHSFGPCILIVGGPLLGAIWLYANGATVEAPASMQPNVTLESGQRYELRWDSQRNGMLATRPENQPTQISRTSWPVSFVLKNIGTIDAQAIRIEWRTETAANDDLIKSSEKLKNVDIKLADGRLKVVSPGAPPFAPHTPLPYLLDLPIETSATTRLSILAGADSETTEMPEALWNNAILYFFATLGQDAGAIAGPFNFVVTIIWGTPKGGEPQKFRVSATAVNARPAGLTSPWMLAWISFDAKKI